MVEPTVDSMADMTAGKMVEMKVDLTAGMMVAYWADQMVDCSVV